MQSEMTKLNIGDISVSCIIPYAGAKRYIQECIGSALKQNFHEIIIVNDSYQKADLAQWNGVSKIRIINLPISIGCPNARNLGVDVCTTSHIVFLDHDDVLADNYLNLILEFIYTYRLRCASGKLKYIGEDSRRVGVSVSNDLGFALPSGFIAEKKLLIEVGGFPDSFSDDFLIFRAIREVTQLRACQDATVLYRIHPNAESSINTKAWMAFNELIPFCDAGQLSLKEANIIAKEYSLHGSVPLGFENIKNSEKSSMCRLVARSAYACWLNRDFKGLTSYSIKILICLPQLFYVVRAKWLSKCK